MTSKRCRRRKRREQPGEKLRKNLLKLWEQLRKNQWNRKQKQPERILEIRLDGIRQATRNSMDSINVPAVQESRECPLCRGQGDCGEIDSPFSLSDFILRCFLLLQVSIKTVLVKKQEETLVCNLLNFWSRCSPRRCGKQSVP